MERIVPLLINGCGGRLDHGWSNAGDHVLSQLSNVLEDWVGGWGAGNMVVPTIFFHGVAKRGVHSDEEEVILG